MPINCYESDIRERLLDEVWLEVDAIYRGIENGELLMNGMKEESFDTWISFFQKRGFDLSHIPQKYLTDRYSHLIKDNNDLKQSIEKIECRKSKA